MNPFTEVAHEKPSRVGLLQAGQRAGKWLRNGFILGVALTTGLLIGRLYFDSLTYLVHIWKADDNYGHGFFIPVISLYLIWTKRQRLKAIGLRGSWWGLALLACGLGLYVAGELSTLYVLLHVSIWVVVVALTVSLVGFQGARAIAFPLAYLLTMIPLPDFLYQFLSGRLQLLSSALGVGCLQGVGIMAFREGNVIDLGPIQLQVVEACSGLRYLFPLVALALLCAYLFRDRLWKRIAVVASSLPIAIALNGLRIGVIGLLVEFYGPGAAEGFLHLFEGWVFFVASLLVLLGEMWLLSRIGPTVTLGSVRPERAHHRMTSMQARSRNVGLWAYTAALALLACTAMASSHLASREDTKPPRRTFLEFPMRIGEWNGFSYPLEQQYINTLRMDDYLLADYAVPSGSPLNFYVAYYGSQRKGQSAHSPKSCIPGGGWEIISIRELQVLSPSGTDPGLTVNRVLIQKGEEKQLVLYWFKQRSRVLTSEYAVKAYLLWDSLTQRRTDGALVRLAAPVRPGENEVSVEKRLATFATLIHPVLRAYVPD